MPLGVVIDAGRKPPSRPEEEEDSKDNWWLHLYVMLSRATTAKDLLVLRAPGEDFLTRGPPADLAVRLRTFAARTTSCRRAAARLVEELGFGEFLHAD